MTLCITENPVAEKGCMTVAWKMVLELRTDTEFQRILLGYDGCAR